MLHKHVLTVYEIVRCDCSSGNVRFFFFKKTEFGTLSVILIWNTYVKETWKTVIGRSMNACLLNIYLCANNLNWLDTCFDGK